MALFEKTNDILDQAKSAVENINGSSSQLADISQEINQGKGTVGALVNDPTLYQRVNAGASAFQEDAEALKHNFLLRGFFHNRGYEDSADLVKDAIRQLPARPSSRKFDFEATCLFDNEKAKLKTKSE